MLRRQHQQAVEQQQQLRWRQGQQRTATDDDNGDNAQRTERRLHNWNTEKGESTREGERLLETTGEQQLFPQQEDSYSYEEEKKESCLCDYYSYHSVFLHYLSFHSVTTTLPFTVQQLQTVASDIDFSQLQRAYNYSQPLQLTYTQLHFGDLQFQWRLLQQSSRISHYYTSCGRRGGDYRTPTATIPKLKAPDVFPLKDAAALRDSWAQTLVHDAWGLTSELQVPPWLPTTTPSSTWQRDYRQRRMIWRHPPDSLHVATTSPWSYAKGLQDLRHRHGWWRAGHLCQEQLQHDKAGYMKEQIDRHTPAHTPFWESTGSIGLHACCGHHLNRRRWSGSLQPETTSTWLELDTRHGTWKRPDGLLRQRRVWLPGAREPLRPSATTTDMGTQVPTCHWFQLRLRCWTCDYTTKLHKQHVIDVTAAKGPGYAYVSRLRRLLRNYSSQERAINYIKEVHPDYNYLLEELNTTKE